MLRFVLWLCLSIFAAFAWADDKCIWAKSNMKMISDQERKKVVVPEMFRRAMASTSGAKTMLNPRNFPRPPLCEKTPRHLEIKWAGQTIAETKDAYWVLETFHPPTYYLPPSSLKIPLARNSHGSFCEWKGRASYYDLTNPSTGEVVKSRVWSYDNPTGGFKDIKDYLSFYAGPWDCYVDGEKVEPQPGDFYGGWTTSDIDTSYVKGAPGTRHW